MKRALPTIFALALILVGCGIVSDSPASGQNDGNVIFRWGSFGLGAKANNESSSPEFVNRPFDVVAVVAGNASEMALDSNGNVWTWGDGSKGVLGDGSTADKISNPVEVSGLPAIVKIAEADDTDVALAANGTVWGWGWNEAGQLCLGNKTDFKRPVELSLSGVVAMAGAGRHMLYLLASGALEACGDNSDGQLGDGSFTGSTTPVAVQGLPSAVSAISAGQTYSTALLSYGQVWDWGYNKYGQLGDGKTQSSDTPVAVELPTTARQVYTGGDDSKDGQSIALLSDGTVWGWGNDRYGQLGNGRTGNATVPVKASSLPRERTWTYVVSGGSDSFAVDSNGDVWGWGNNDEGQVGTGSSSDVLHPVEVLRGADMVSATADDSVAQVGF